MARDDNHAQEWIIGSEVHELINWSPFEDEKSVDMLNMLINEQSSDGSDDSDKS